VTCLLWVTLLLLYVTFIPGIAFSAVDPPQLKSSTALATDGFYTLSWTSGASEFELQQSASKDFQQTQPVYIGPDTATVISGVSDSVRFYRVRSTGNDQAGPWSDTVQVTVQHPAFSRALLFLFTGIVVFIATVLLMAFGARTHREQR
jgi:hypothetical protein